MNWAIEQAAHCLLFNSTTATEREREKLRIEGGRLRKRENNDSRERQRKYTYLFENFIKCRTIITFIMFKYVYCI